MGRAVDIVCASLALVIFAPVLVVVALLIKMRMGSPILFKQQRTGLNGTLFTLLKFRTMRNTANCSTQTDSVRITKLGNVLRSTSLDELPTLINVIFGHMTLVGPRPLLPQYLPRYTAYQARRHEVKPGVTGWAQVNGRNSLSWEEKFDLDVWYVDNRSALLDIKILLLTIIKVFKRSDISADGNATMPEFMGQQQERGQR